MAIRFTARAMMRNMGAAHSVKGIGGAYAKRAIIGGAIGGIGGGTLEAVQGGSFGEGFVKGGIGGAAFGAGSVAFTAAGLGKNMFEEGTSRIAKGSFRKSGSSIAKIHREGQIAGRMCKEGTVHIDKRMADLVHDGKITNEVEYNRLKKQRDLLHDIKVGKAKVTGNANTGFDVYDYRLKKSVGKMDDDMAKIYNSYHKRTYVKGSAKGMHSGPISGSTFKNQKNKGTYATHKAKSAGQAFAGYDGSFDT